MRIKVARIGLALLGFLGLAFIRFCESELFYDPLLAFFKTAYQGKALPDLVLGKYLIHVALRFGANMIFSLLIIWAFFKDNGILRVTLVLSLIHI